MGSLDLVAELELSLLTPGVRGDRGPLETLLHPDFVEVGASGRRWTRSEMVDALVGTPTVDGVQPSDVRARALSDEVVLVTYTTRRGSAAAHRSSIWVRHANQWVVLYHQGTPLEVAPSDLSE